MFRSVYIAAGVVVAVVLSLFMWSVLRPTPPSRVRTPSPVPAPLVHTPEDAAADVDTRLPEIPVAEPSIPSLPPEDALDAPPPSLGGPLDVPVAPAVRRSEPAPAATRVTGIARAQFTREVRSREPVDNITRLGRKKNTNKRKGGKKMENKKKKVRKIRKRRKI